MADTPASDEKPRFNFRDTLALLRYSAAFKKEYIVMVVFVILQMATYQALAYSLKYLINDIYPVKRLDYLLYFAAAWAVAFGLHGLCTVAAAHFRIVIVRNLIANLRADIIRKLQVIAIRYFDQRGTGTTSTKLLMDMDRIQNFFEWIMISFLQSVFGIILIIPLLSTINPILTIISVLYIPTIPLIQRFFWDLVSRWSHELRDTNAGLSEKLVDYISGIKQIRVFAAENEQSSRILEEIQRVKIVDIRYSTIMRNFSMVIQFINEFMPTVLWVCAGIIMIKSTTLSLGAVVAYITLVRMALGNVYQLFSTYDQIVMAIPSVKAVNEVLKHGDIENQQPRITQLAVDGSVQFRDVHFSYQSREGQCQLMGIDLAIKPGEKVAFVGESGAGKSTIVNVLLGLYPIENGSVTIAGHDLRDISLRSMRSQIAVMAQETFLFNTTIGDNIRFARINATTDDIIAASKKAEIFDFITSLPQGFDSAVGERGVQLSGGQRQRIGLARVFLRDPAMIILDEPSSSLDVFTEQKLFETLFKNIAGKTLLIVAHRLSTIKNVDRIVVLKQGRIVEEGRFEELLAAGGYFAEMVHLSSESTRIS